MFVNFSYGTAVQRTRKVERQLQVGDKTETFR